MSNISLYVLFFTIPLIHSSFLNYFGFDFNSLVNGNFEFTKVVFFNIVSSITIVFFLIEKVLKKEDIKIYYKKLLFLIIFVSILSTIFSISQFISFFGNKEKAHSFIFIINLLGIFIVLSNKKKKELDKFLKITLSSLFLVFIIGIKEYFFPSLNYINTLNTAISTLGNNQYYALSIILLLPIILKKYDSKYKFLYLILLFFCLLISKSIIGIIIFIVYLIFFLFGKKRGLIISILLLILSSIIILIYYPEKIHSFISRFFIWQNVISIYLDNFKNMIFGYGIETLDLSFTREKNPYLYIFENYGFIADRSHNIWLDILYSTGLFGFILSIYITYLILITTKKTYYYDIFIIFFVFCFFNFAGVTHYIFILLVFSLFLKQKNKPDTNFSSLNTKYLLIIPIFFYLYITIFSTKFYIAEIYYKLGNTTKSANIFNYPYYYFEIGDYKKGLAFFSYPPISYYQNIIKNDSVNTKTHCDELVSKYDIAENYIFCGDMLNLRGQKNESMDYYKKGLSKLPDLWNENSIYYNNIIIKHTITGNRFLSEKYGNLNEIIKLFY